MDERPYLSRVWRASYNSRIEWVVGTTMATIVMAAYCHPRPTGGRFSLPDRGAWYAAIDQQTAIRETIHHYTKEFFDEIGVTETYVQVREYLADFDASFHDVRSAFIEACYANDDYEPGQQLGAALLRAGSNGLLYASVRHPGHDCIVCFRPPLVLNVRQAAHFEYRWHGQREPEITPLASG